MFLSHVHSALKHLANLTIMNFEKTLHQKRKLTKCLHIYILHETYSEAVIQRCSVKYVVLKISQNSQKNTSARASSSINFLIKFIKNFIKKDTLAQVFSYEFYEIPNSTFFTEYLWTTASTQRPR